MLDADLPWTQKLLAMKATVQGVPFVSLAERSPLFGMAGSNPNLETVADVPVHRAAAPPVARGLSNRSAESVSGNQRHREQQLERL